VVTDNFAKFEKCFTSVFFKLFVDIFSVRSSLVFQFVVKRMRETALYVFSHNFMSVSKRELTFSL
jgi:hypothetical protein